MDYKSNAVGITQHQRVRVEKKGGEEKATDAEFHRFLREVVLREKPGTQTAPSPKRKSPNGTISQRLRSKRVKKEFS